MVIVCSLQKWWVNIYISKFVAIFLPKCLKILSFIITPQRGPQPRMERRNACFQFPENTLNHSDFLFSSFLSSQCVNLFRFLKTGLLYRTVIPGCNNTYSSCLNFTYDKHSKIPSLLRYRQYFRLDLQLRSGWAPPMSNIFMSKFHKS